MGTDGGGAAGAESRLCGNGTTAVASLVVDSTAEGCPPGHELALDRAPPLEGSAERHFVGVLEVAADGKAARET